VTRSRGVTSVIVAFAALGLASAACEHPPAKPPETPCGPSEAEIVLDELIDRTPAFGRSLGLHEYDGKIDDYSPKGIAARRAELERWKAYLDGVDPRRLGADDALDLALVKLELAQELFHLDDTDDWEKRPMYYEELFSIDGYLNRDYAPLDARAAAVLSHAEKALKQTRYVTENLVGPMSKPVLETAILIYRGYADYLSGDATKILSGVADKKLRADVLAAVAALSKEAARIADTLERTELPRGDDSHVLGPERYAKLLEVQEALHMPIAELEKMGEDDLAKNRKAYEALAAKVTPKRPPASELLADATKLTSDAKAFILEHHLATIPGDEPGPGGAPRLQVKETPAFMRYNSAFLDAPGPFDNPELAAFFYITPPDPKWSAKEQEEYIMPFGTLQSTSVHEVYPGHYLHSLFLRRAPTKVERALASYSFTEGWAHYGEQMMLDEGFGADDPENRLGQLGDALLRDCRVVVSIGIHTKGMAVEQAKRRFMDDCKQDEASAREQAVRGTFDPGYFAYTLGKLQIIALRDEAKAKLGARFDLGKFHDALLAHGAPPVPLIRDRVLAELAR
jgi:hypothetical protein